jgi:hypothetical protein|tara:strand:- start:639 stop:1217 length:579 start_codon:yes stop_codon:yes gene_type:complete
MANVAEKFGLRPYKSLNGSPWNNAQNKYTIKSNYGTAIFQGDLVIPTSTGNIERHTAGNGSNVVGVFNGVFYTDPTTKKPTFSNYYPGSIVASDIVANVIDDPDTLFLMDADAAFTRDNLYKNYSVTNVTGNTATGISKVQLDVSTGDSASTFMVQAVDISQDPNNSDTATANANVIVRINRHFFRDGTGLT